MTTALIIEDNEDNCALLVRILNSAGIETEIAETGEEGYRMALKLKPELVLLDIQLPDIEGTEVLRRLRCDPIGKGLVVVAVTSYAMPGDEEDLIKDGCNGYIEKPIDPFNFIDQIQSIMELAP